MTDIRTQLAALLGHLNHHPHLVDHLATANLDDQGRIRVHPVDIAAELPQLAAWAKTLTDGGTIRITATPDGEVRPYTHLRLDGNLPTGQQIAVTVCLNDDETGELAAIPVPVVVGATFSVEQLVQLVDRIAVETAIGDALTAQRLDPIRYFRDPNGVRWRVHPDQLVQVWDADRHLWIESNKTLTDLETHDEITEDPDRSELPDVPPTAVVEQARAMVADGRKIPAIRLVREHTRLGLREARDYVATLAVTP